VNIILLLKQLTPPIIWRHLKKLKKKQKYFALNSLDQKLEKYLNYNNGYFVELGANDGISQSNTFYYEKNKNWNGILIEPILHKYIECKKKRSNKNKYFCNACVSFEHDKEFVKLLYSNLMTVPTNLQSDIHDKFAHANHSNTIREDQEEVIEFFAKAKTLNSILIECDAPKKIDLLSVDVEGAEIEVIKGINFESYKFKYILIESRNIQPISELLNQKSYKLIQKMTHHDYLFGLNDKKFVSE
jgi:FkbM family methyltransferase